MENVTPVFQKAVVGKDLFEIIAFHNRLYRWFARNSRHYRDTILEMITAHCKKSHPKLKKLPRTPPIEADMGFLSDGLLPNRNGDFKCFVLTNVTRPQYNIVAPYEEALYAYKLRAGSSHLNGTPEGYVNDEVREARVLTYTTVWASQLG